MNDKVALIFGVSMTLGYLAWAVAYSQTIEKHMGVALFFYACANVALMWPLIRRVLA